MTRHIKLWRLMDFYVKITKLNPDVIPNVTANESINVNRSCFNEEDLKTNLDRVNMWIGNCDQKASFLLALIGVGLTIICTSDLIKFLRTAIIMPFKKYLKFGTGEIDWYALAIALCIMYISILVVFAIYMFIYTLRAKTDLKRFEQPGLESNSMLHYKSVSERNYSEYCTDIVHLLNDLRSQTYVNSMICTDKFMYYKRGVRCIEWAIPAVILLALLILFY